MSSLVLLLLVWERCALSTAAAHVGHLLALGVSPRPWVAKPPRDHSDVVGTARPALPRVKTLH